MNNSQSLSMVAQECPVCQGAIPEILLELKPLKHGLDLEFRS